MTVKTTTREVGPVTVIDVSGRVTAGPGSTVVSEQTRELMAAGHTKILLNLGELLYVDSSGLGDLVASLTAVTKGGGALKLLNPTKRILELLKITHVESLFQIFDNEEAAVESFS